MSNDFIRAGDRVDDLADDLEDEITDGVNDGLDGTKREMEVALRRNQSVASRSLLLSLNHIEIPTPRSEIIHLSGIEALPHWVYLEHGTGLRGEGEFSAGSPSPDTILEWIKQKNIRPRYYESQDELSFAIAESIREFGTKPHPFVRPAWHGSRYGRAHVIQKAQNGMHAAVRRF